MTTTATWPVYAKYDNHQHGQEEKRKAFNSYIAFGFGVPEVEVGFGIETYRYTHVCVCAEATTVTTTTATATQELELDLLHLITSITINVYSNTTHVRLRRNICRLSRRAEREGGKGAASRPEQRRNI